jgi:hypothetical protein
MIGIKDVRCLTCRQTVGKRSKVQESIQSSSRNAEVGSFSFAREGKKKARTSHEERKIYRI